MKLLLGEAHYRCECDELLIIRMRLPTLAMRRSSSSCDRDHIRIAPVSAVAFHTVCIRRRLLTQLLQNRRE